MSVTLNSKRRCFTFPTMLNMSSNESLKRLILIDRTSWLPPCKQSVCRTQPSVLKMLIAKLHTWRPDSRRRRQGSSCGLGAQYWLRHCRLLRLLPLPQLCLQHPCPRSNKLCYLSARSWACTEQRTPHHWTWRSCTCMVHVMVGLPSSFLKPFMPKSLLLSPFHKAPEGLLCRASLGFGPIKTAARRTWFSLMALSWLCSSGPDRVSPSHATGRSPPLILLSAMLAPTIAPTSSCVEPAQQWHGIFRTRHKTSCCSQQPYSMHAMLFRTTPEGSHRRHPGGGRRG